jgi:hypothetical protein
MNTNRLSLTNAEWQWGEPIYMGGYEPPDADGAFARPVRSLLSAVGERVIVYHEAYWLPPQEVVDLIAAAPALLKACEEMLSEIRAYQGEAEHEPGPVQDWCNMLSAAIAKARGG